MEQGIQELTERLLAANRAYYDDGESDLSDDEYDAIRRHLMTRGINIDTLTPPPKGSEWPVREHAEHMQGIPLCAKTEKEWVWDIGHGGFEAGTVSIKYDGLSVEMVYKDGVLVHCILRGDGAYGEDVYANARRVGSVPAEVDHQWLDRWLNKDCERGQERYKGTFSVFGELVISWNNLAVVNELREAEGKRPYKSPRSAVSMVRGRGNGQLMQYMKFRPFGISPVGGKGQRADLVGLKRASGNFDPVDVEDNVPPLDAWRRLKVIERRRGEFSFQMDGVVYVDDSGTRAKLKFAPESGVTTVTKIVEQLGRTGVVAPVVEFEPIDLVGATVVRATGHNAVLMEERLKGLGVGAKILVTRRGDVIPHIERVIEATDEAWTPGDECPSCGSEILVDGSIRRCSAQPGECPGTSSGLIVKYCKSLSIEGVGPAMGTIMVGSGLVSVPADLYTMDVETLAMCSNGVSTVGSAIARKIHANIVERIEMTWGEMLGAIGIPGCASSVMEDVSKRFGDPQELREASEEDLADIEGIGPVRAAKIRMYVHTRWDDVIAPLLEVVSIKSVGKQLDGKTFCITLSLRSCGRSEMEARIRAAGGTPKSSVSKKLDYLVCNTPDAATSKLKRARTLGIPIISEEELIEMMGGDSGDIVEADIDMEDPF